MNPKDLPKEYQLAAQAQRLAEAEDLLREFNQKSITEEWPDCGKPYWYCELCGEMTENGQDITDLVHDKDCPIPKAKAFLTPTPANHLGDPPRSYDGNLDGELKGGLR